MNPSRKHVPKTEKGPRGRFTLDLPLAVWKHVKITAIHARMTGSEYIRQLILDDMERKGAKREAA